MAGTDRGHAPRISQLGRLKAAATAVRSASTRLPKGARRVYGGTVVGRCEVVDRQVYPESSVLPMRRGAGPRRQQPVSRHSRPPAPAPLGSWQTPLAIVGSTQQQVSPLEKPTSAKPAQQHRILPTPDGEPGVQRKGQLLPQPQHQARLCPQSSPLQIQPQNLDAPIQAGTECKQGRAEEKEQRSTPEPTVTASGCQHTHSQPLHSLAAEAMQPKQAVATANGLEDTKEQRNNDDIVGDGDVGNGGGGSGGDDDDDDDDDDDSSNNHNHNNNNSNSNNNSAKQVQHIHASDAKSVNNLGAYSTKRFAIESHHTPQTCRLHTRTGAVPNKRLVSSPTGKLLPPMEPRADVGSSASTVRSGSEVPSDTGRQLDIASTTPLLELFQQLRDLGVPEVRLSKLMRRKQCVALLAELTRTGWVPPSRHFNNSCGRRHNSSLMS